MPKEERYHPEPWVVALAPLGPPANDRPGQVQIELLQIAPVPSTYRSIPRWKRSSTPDPLGL